MDRITMASEHADLQKMSKNMRFFVLHREECNALRRMRYHNQPDVIAKREEREQKKREKEAAQQAEKEAKHAEKERKKKLQMEIALVTRNIPKKNKGGLSLFLGSEAESSGVGNPE